MKVLILGGTGFIGRHLTRNLLNAGHEVAVFHRGRRRVPFRRRVLHIYGNRSRLEESVRAFASFSPDVVVDLIAFTEADAKSAVQVFGDRVERFVCASSMDVYQAYGAFLRLESSKPTNRALAEESPLRTVLFPYRGAAKNENDFLLRYEKILVERAIMNSTAFSAAVLRLPQVFGPYDNQHRLRDYLQRMDAGKDIVINQARARWRWTRGYVEDIAAGFVLAVTNPKASGRIYNIGEKEAESERDWIHRVGKASGWKGQLRIVREDAIPNDRSDRYDWNHHLAGETGRIRRELGYLETTDPGEAMKRSVRWERSEI
jgi:nucleoside-diphosphate-sugar epimerase